MVSFLEKCKLSKLTQDDIENHQSVKQKCCIPYSFTRIKSLATAVADLQCTMKGIQDQEQDEALCALGKQAKQALR